MPLTKKEFDDAVWEIKKFRTRPVKGTNGWTYQTVIEEKVINYLRNNHLEKDKETPPIPEKL